MKIKRFLIQNFQSIGEIELFFEENGCYHIRGENNVGKSNIIKAFYAILRNIPSTQLKFYLKHGTKSLFLEVEDFDHNIVRLSRGADDFYSWVIDGEEGMIEGTAGKVPQEVTTFFNMYEEFTKTKQVVNIRLPRAPFLFIDTTEADNYYLLQKALNIEEYLGAIKLGESEKRNQKQEVESLMGDKKRAMIEKDELPDNTRFLDEIKVYQDTLEANMALYRECHALIALYEEIEELENFIEQSNYGYDAEKMAQDVDNLQKLISTIALMESIDELNTVISEKSGIIELHEQTKSVYDNYNTVLEQLSAIEHVVALQDDVQHRENEIVALTEIIDTYEQSDIKQQIQHLREAYGILDAGDMVKASIVESDALEKTHIEAEKSRTDFMREHNFCPVVMATRNRTCPFSGKPIEELLS